MQSCVPDDAAAPLLLQGISVKVFQPTFLSTARPDCQCHDAQGTASPTETVLMSHVVTAKIVADLELAKNSACNQHIELVSTY
eukprot:5316313-Amphidinium_carterae.1